MSEAVAINAFSATGRAVRRVVTGCTTRDPVGEPDQAHIARLAIASVVIPLWVALASLTARHLTGSGGDLALLLASFLKLFVLQTLALVPIFACMKYFRRIGALGGNGALPDFALVLHLSGGVAMALKAGDPAAGAAAIALQQLVVYGLSIAMILAAAGRGVVAASPVLVAAGVLSAIMPPCIVVLTRVGTAFVMHIAGFPEAVSRSARWVNGLL